MILAFVVLCCVRSAPPAQLGPDQGLPGGPVEVMRRSVTGPVPIDVEGWCLDVPNGWSGSSGGAPALFRLVDDSTGAEVSLWSWPASEVIPAPRAGFDLAFYDADTYRFPPSLAPTATYTLVNAEGEVVQGWTSLVGGRNIVVEVQALFGRTTISRDRAEGLLMGLRRCDAGG